MRRTIGLPLKKVTPVFKKEWVDEEKREHLYCCDKNTSSPKTNHQMKMKNRLVKKNKELKFQSRKYIIEIDKDEINK